MSYGGALLQNYMLRCFPSARIFSGTTKNQIPNFGLRREYFPMRLCHRETLEMPLAYYFHLSRQGQNDHFWLCVFLIIFPKLQRAHHTLRGHFAPAYLGGSNKLRASLEFLSMGYIHSHFLTNYFKTKVWCMVK